MLEAEKINSPVIKILRRPTRSAKRPIKSNNEANVSA
ncbi:unannotated protein [freshwater metagenome]|uniref:Unannotated protein n=1 Tax=freshwater metagenome TaxID=449393 RepID=A0A6J6W5K0_9ZZZZ